MDKFETFEMRGGGSSKNKVEKNGGQVKPNWIR